MTQPSVASAEVLETLRRFSSGMIDDALLMAGIEGGLLGIHPARGFEDAKIVGPATTVLFGRPEPGAP
jgi:hypothetical protein